MVSVDQELDVTELKCPMPLLQAKAALSRMGSGQVLSVITTDPISVKDFEALSKQLGTSCSRQAAGKFYFLGLSCGASFSL